MDTLFNPLLFIGMGVLCAALIYAAWRINGERLFSAIIVFLILITITGGKIVSFFGHETNVGNLFYASVFLATYLLIERYGKRAGIRSIGLGVVFVAFVALMLQMVVFVVGSGSSSGIDAAMTIVFGFSPRLAFASLSAYVCAQSINVFLYTKLRERWESRFVWLRANLANAVAQIFDSIIFFSVAFWGVVPPSNMLDSITTGYLIKVLFMGLFAPLLYLNRVEEDEDGNGFLTLTFLR